MVVKKEQGLKSSPAEAGGFNQKEDYKINICLFSIVIENQLLLKIM